MYKFFLYFLFFLFSITSVQAEVLNSSDVHLYQDIFALQNNSQIEQAKLKQKELENPLLMGYVLYQRYF